MFLNRPLSGMNMTEPDNSSELSLHSSNNNRPRNPTLDALIEEGTSIGQMARTIDRSTTHIRNYLVSRGLYEQWKSKAVERESFFPRKNSAQFQRPKWLKDRKKFPEYDPVEFYSKGTVLFFGSLGAGKIVQVDGRQIVVKFENERRRYVHGLREDPYQRRNSIDR